MSLNSISASQYTDTYSAYKNETTSKTNTDKNNKISEDKAAVYEKSTTDVNAKKATYSINKMSDTDRAALVKQMKADQNARQQNLVSLVTKMMNKQATASSIANNDTDSIWKFLADGNFTVDAATKAQAQEDISEDGYWGVNQTSQRLFDFASALAGDDPEKMKKMQEAMEKGFKQATKSWGKDLPDICQNTLDAANKLFDDYYNS